MAKIERSLLTLALGAALALPAWAQSAPQDSGSQDAQQDAQQSTQQDTTAQSTGSQTDANGWQAGQSSSANMQSDTTLTGDSFGTLDTDHDGRLSSDEAGASASLNGRFKSLDTNGDGYVSQSEYSTGLRATRTPTTTP